MPSSLASFAEFDAMLGAARAELGPLLVLEPDDRALQSVALQLQALHGWTRGGRCPLQAEKDQLNFGAIASRELDHHPLAGKLYELASFVIYWGEAGG